VAVDEPRGGEERSWQDRDTEPIPRARFDPPPDEPPHADDRVHPGDDGDPFDQERPSPHGAPPPPDDFADYNGAGYPDDRFPDDRYPDNPYRDERYPDEPFIDERLGSTTVGASLVVGEPITEEELGGLRGGMGTPLVTSRRVVPLEDEPTPLVQRYLFPTEKFRGEWRRHPIQLAKEIGIAAGATIVMGLLAGYLTRIQAAPEIVTFLALGWFAVLVWAGWQIADWWYDRFILTNKRVMVVSGIITRNVAMMPLQRVTDMKYVQSPLGRMLNYGTFELESAGQDQALRSIPHLPSPNELYLRIVEEMYEPEAVEARLAGAPDLMDDGT